MASFPSSKWNRCLDAMRDEPVRSTEKGPDRETPLRRGLSSGSDVEASQRTVAARVGTAPQWASRTDRFVRTASTRSPGDASSRNRWDESRRDREYSASLRRLDRGVKRHGPALVANDIRGARLCGGEDAVPGRGLLSHRRYRHGPLLGGQGRLSLCEDRCCRVPGLGGQKCSPSRLRPGRRA